jgi:hypothetical protein
MQPKMSPPAITSPFTEPPQSFGTEGLNISEFQNSNVIKILSKYASKLGQRLDE